MLVNFNEQLKIDLEEVHHVNSLTNDLIGPNIPCPASAPALGLAVLLLPPWVEFTPSHIWDEPLDCPHLETYDALLEPLVYPASISHDVNLSTLNWAMGTHHGTSLPYTKDGPNHEHEEHDSWKEGPVMTLGHNTSHSLSWHHFISFSWLHHQSMDGIATDMSSLCLLLVLLFLLLWSLCSSQTKHPYINCYNMFVVL